MPPGYSMAKHNIWYSRYRCKQLKKLAAGADVRISASNIMDFGRPAHHFINVIDIGDDDFMDFVHHRTPSTGAKIRRLLQNRILKPLSGLRTKWATISDLREHIYPNSEFVNGLLHGYYPPFNGTVFYPPTTFEFNDPSVPRDPLLAIYVGRIFPPKRITDLVAIVEKARSLSGKDIRFRIAGALQPMPYTELLRSLAAERPWMELVGPVYGSDKEKFMLSATYALHAERDEAFGIAIAEYLKAGCIPIVPDTGGPKEIVDDRALEFHTVESAAGILSRLVGDDAFREARRSHCTARAAKFSLEAYKDHQQAVVERMLGDVPPEERKSR
jgi:glycosyltransferase involved in cell wall biosynthesis